MSLNLLKESLGLCKDSLGFVEGPENITDQIETKEGPNKKSKSKYEQQKKKTGGNTRKEKKGGEWGVRETKKKNIKQQIGLR